MSDDQKTREELVEELMATREALNSARAMTDLIINNVPAGIAFLDGELVYRWLNPRAEAFFAHLGIGAERVIGAGLGEVFPAPMEVGQLFHAALEAGAPIERNNQAIVRREQGIELTTYWDFTCVPLYQAGRFAGMLAFNQEVTERVEKELLQKERIARLEELDHLKSNFLNTASHELRTPLTSIVAYAEFLEDGIGGPLTDQQSEFLDQIRDGASRLQHLVDDLIDFSRLEAGDLPLYPQAIDMADLVREQVQHQRARADARRIQVSLDLQPGACPITVDPMRIGQVVAHLVDNAIKFTPEGGRVEIRLKHDDDQVLIEIADTGIGIPDDHIDQLFTKFYQVDPSMTRAYGGAGLGLSICKAIVMAHGGAIGVRSHVGQGSTFWFSLPVASKLSPALLDRAYQRGT